MPMVGVYLAYRQIHSDNEIKNKELQQKQENAETSYSDLASLDFLPGLGDQFFQ